MFSGKALKYTALCAVRGLWMKISRSAAHCQEDPAFESLAESYHHYAVFQDIFWNVHTSQGAKPLDLYVQEVREYLEIKGLH